MLVLAKFQVAVRMDLRKRGMGLGRHEGCLFVKTVDMLNLILCLNLAFLRHHDT